MPSGVRVRLQPRAAAFLAACTLGVAACSAHVPREPAAEVPAVQHGIASWYGPGFHGQATSSGETYDQHAWTAAHRTLPLGTPVAVTNLDNGRRVEVRINDRGPFVKSRLIDLSFAAAEALDMIGPGTAPVRLEVLDPAALALGPPRYAVQVGSFTDRERARHLEERLAPDFEDVHVVRFEHDAGLHYRVRVGRFATIEEAQRQASLVARLGLPTMVVEEFGEP